MNVSIGQDSSGESWKDDWSPGRDTPTVLHETHGGLPGHPESGSEAGAEFVFQRGACLGRYVVLRAVGSGGMGNVYAAFDPELDRRVALKALRADLLVSERREQAQSRLLREAQATAKLAHPNVVAVYDMGTVGKRLFIAMELIEGMSLTEWLAAAERSRREILEVFLQAGRGLAAAHRGGLVHRDFKPGNVMIGDEGRARVVDFGLARASGQGHRSREKKLDTAPQHHASEHRHASEHHAPRLTRTGRALGTPAYMSPEQYEGTADARSDQFSYCLALYEALYGESPFGGETVATLRRNVKTGNVREAPMNSPVPSWLRRILLRGLSPRPEARFPAMDDLLAALAKDPATRRCRLAAVAAAFLTLTATFVGFSHLESRGDLLCNGAERKLVGIWDGPTKTVLREAFVATGVVYAEDTWRRVETSLDSYAGAWVTMHTEACEATRRRGEQSEEMLDRQMACLSTRVQEIKALSELFARADAQVVDNAARAADRLSRLAACEDHQALLTDIQPPKDSATAARVNQIRARLVEARALRAVGKYSEVLELARAAAQAAEELSYRPLIAEAHLELGRVQGRLRDFADMKENLLKSARLAQAVHYDEVLAKSMSLLIVSAARRGQIDEAHLVAELARGAIERLGHREDLEAARRTYLAGLAVIEGLYEQALDHYLAALNVEAVTGFNRAAMLTNVGNIYLKLGRFDEAREASHQALRGLENVLGPEHRQVMGPLLNLGELLAARGDFEAALPYFQRSLLVIDRTGRQDDPDAAFGLTGSGRALIELGRASEAVELLERAARIREGEALDPALLAETRYHLARALEASAGNHQRARDLAVQARQTYAELGERTARELQQVETWLRMMGWLP